MIDKSYILTIVDTIEYLAREEYRKDPALYHHDYKIALYGCYMDVVSGVGELLRNEGKGD